MADIIRYIDTEVSGGTADGSSWANAYSSFAAWLAAEGGNVAAGDRHLANFRGALDAATVAVDLAAAGFTGDGELHLTGDLPNNPVSPGSGYVWQAWNTSQSFIVGDVGNLKVVLNNFERRFTGNYIGAGIALDSAAGADIGFNHCVNDYRGVQATNNPIDLYINGTSGAAINVVRNDCLIITEVAANQRDIEANYASGANIVSNRCTITGGFTDVLARKHASGTIAYNSCAIENANSNANCTMTNCATNDGTGTNPVTVSNWASEFVDATNDDYTLTSSSQLLDAGISGVNIGVDQITAAANVDPVLDSLISDISVPTNTSGTIVDISTHFSDANAGDVLTYSVSPSLPSGMSLDTNTGIVSGDGNITVTTATNHTFTASDGHGGTDATDVVSIEVTAPTPAVTAITPCRLGEPFTVTVEHFDLTTADTLELRIDGSAITGPASFTATTATFNMPAGGFQIKSGAVFVLRITAGAIDIDIPIGPALSQVPTGDQAYTFGKPVVASNGDWLLLGTAGSDHVSADNRLVLMESPSGLNQGQEWTNPVDIFKDHTDDASFESSTRQFILFREPETGDIISITGTLKTNFNPFTEGYHRVHSHRRASGGTTWVTTEITSQIPDATFGNDKMIAHGSVVETVNGLAMCVYAGDEVKILFSTDQANTWGNAVTVGDAPKGTHNLTATEPELLALTPSKLVLVCRHNENAGTKAYMTSNDGGINWSNRSAYTTVGESGCTVDQPVAMKLIGDYVYFAFPCRLPTGKLITNIVHKDDVDANPAELWNPSSPNRQTPYSSNTLDSQNEPGNTQAYIDFGNAYIADIPGNPGEALITFFDHAPYPENPVHTVQLNVGTFPDLVS